MPNLCSRACCSRSDAGACQRMTHFHIKPFVTSVAMLAAMLMTACVSTGTPQDGRYQTHGGGMDNFRAEAPTIPEPTRAS
jgi:hypothetical protein